MCTLYIYFICFAQYSVSKEGSRHYFFIYIIFWKRAYHLSANFCSLLVHTIVVMLCCLLNTVQVFT